MVDSLFSPRKRYNQKSERWKRSQLCMSTQRSFLALLLNSKIYSFKKNNQFFFINIFFLLMNTRILTKIIVSIKKINILWLLK
jgi:hypothetical protein